VVGGQCAPNAAKDAHDAAGDATDQTGLLRGPPGVHDASPFGIRYSFVLSLYSSIKLSCNNEMIFCGLQWWRLAQTRHTIPVTRLKGGGNDGDGATMRDKGMSGHAGRR
jgi:hypothetical protein